MIFPNTSSLSNAFVQQLVKAMEFLLDFRGRHHLPFQLINKIGLLSPGLKNDVATRQHLKLKNWRLLRWPTRNITVLKSAVMALHTPGGWVVTKVLGKLFLLGIQSSEFWSWLMSQKQWKPVPLWEGATAWQEAQRWKTVLHPRNVHEWMWSE